jgi:hypothetical protein
MFFSPAPQKKVTAAAVLRAGHCAGTFQGINTLTMAIMQIIVFLNNIWVSIKPG